MAPKKNYIPLFLLSISVLVLYSHYHSSLHTPQSTPNFNQIKLKNPNPNFTFTIKLLAYDRIESLSRCLRSLSNADYGEDTVNLHVYIDHFPVLNSTRVGDFADLDEKLELSRRILDLVDGFVWNYGGKVVHYRTENVGLQAQWLEAWWPGSDNEFAFVVEDDLEVSPLYYTFLKGLILNYYYNVSNFSPDIYGASLQLPRLVPGKRGNKLHLENESRLFLYQLVGTWGQLLFPKPWKEFRLWYDEHKAKGIKPFLPEMKTNDWYKRKGERIWTPWFIKFIHSRGYFNIYTNFQDERALSTSFRDSGVNYKKSVGPDATLLNKSSLDFNLLEMQSLSTLKWHDFCFREVLPGRIIRNFNDLASVIHPVQNQKTVILVSLFRASETVIRNLICHFERLNIQKYVFIGQGSKFMHDLARRGHPVIEADQFFDNIEDLKSTGLQKSNVELLVKEIVVKAYVVKKCLESNFNSLLVDGNMVFNSSDLYHDFLDDTHDFYAGKMTDFLFIRSSLPSVKIWSQSCVNLLVSLLSKGLIPNGDKNVVSIVTLLLEKKGVKVERVDEASKKMIFWSSEVSGELIQKKLEELGMWVIDLESSCKAVTCHQS